MIYLSLCLPTNGISEWVFPVLDSIFIQGVDPKIYEVIVTDNGNNKEFKQTMQEYLSRHKNLIYQETDAYLFKNQISALRLANGEYLKFINHRSLLKENSIRWMIELVKANIDKKPTIYLSNGTLKNNKQVIYNNFNDFVAGLKELASWTTGVGVWKCDFKNIPENHEYNKISPHSDILFYNKDKNSYLIDDYCWSKEIDSSHQKKGNYDLYKCFACEELAITFNLYLNGYITSKTFRIVKKAYEELLVNLYYKFSIQKQPCSYNLNGFDDNINIFFNKKRIVIKAYIKFITAIIFKIINLFKKVKK